jgi:hypothetical protein
MKAIAVGSPKRLPDFPNLPATAEVLPGDARGWAALVAPVGTPDAIVNKVSDALGKVVGETEVQKKLAVTSSYVRPMSPGEVMAFIQADQQMWKYGFAAIRSRMGNGGHSRVQKLWSVKWGIALSARLAARAAIGHAAHERDELAPFHHSITSSAPRAAR